MGTDGGYGSGFQPLNVGGVCTQGVALGWDGAGPSALRHIRLARSFYFYLGLGAGAWGLAGGTPALPGKNFLVYLLTCWRGGAVVGFAV